MDRTHHTQSNKIKRHLFGSSMYSKPRVCIEKHDAHSIKEFMTYDRFLDVKHRRSDVICYSRVTKILLIPRYLQEQNFKHFKNRKRSYFPIYIQLTKNEYHAVVLLWNIAHNELYYYNSWGNKPNNVLLIVFKDLFPGVKTIKYNNVRHQIYDHLCTSYAFNAADRFMNNESFENICNNKTSVRDLLKYRANVMTKPYNKTPHEITEFSLHCAKC
jgi:hypothetical protein